MTCEKYALYSVSSTQFSSFNWFKGAFLTRKRNGGISRRPFWINAITTINLMAPIKAANGKAWRSFARLCTAPLDGLLDVTNFSGDFGYFSLHKMNLDLLCLSLSQ